MTNNDRFRLREMIVKRGQVTHPLPKDKEVISFWLTINKICFFLLICQLLNQRDFLSLSLLITDFLLWLTLHKKLKGV